jgi:hypothetical protein
MSTALEALRRRHAGAARATDPGTDAQAELALLREENRRLEAQLGRPADLAQLMSRVRLAQDPVDEAAGLLADDLVVRESLLEVTRELQRVLADVEARLGTPGA